MTSRRTAILLSSLLMALSGSGYAKDWKVFCVQEKHLDVGWSYLRRKHLTRATRGLVEEFQVFLLALAMYVQGHTTQHRYPTDARYKWYVDSAWQIEQMEKYHPQLMPKLRQLINDDEFSYNPMYANLHTMMLGHETLMRTLSYGRLLERKGFRRSYMAKRERCLLGRMGIRVHAGFGRNQVLHQEHMDTGPSVTPGIVDGMVQPAPLFRWVGADGKKVLFYYGGSYFDAGGNDGEALSEAKLRTRVERFEKLSSEGKWPYDAFPLFGSEGDFGIPDIDNPNFVREWNRSHPAIRLIIATPEAFFEYIEKNFNDKIPDGVTGGWGVSHDIEETTFAKPGARARANDHAMLAAEAFACWPSSDQEPRMVSTKCGRPG